MTWYHDGLLLDKVATVARNSSHQTLILEPVTHKDIGELERCVSDLQIMMSFGAGEYICLASNSVGEANPPRMGSPVAFPKHASAPEAAIAEQLLPVRRCPKSPPACALSSTAVAPIVPPQPPKTPRGSWRGRGGQGAGHHLPPLTISSFPLSPPPVGASSGRDLLLRATSVRRKPSSSHHRREPWPPSHHTTNDFSAIFCLSRENQKKQVN